MRWQKCILYKELEIGIDELGNKVLEFVPFLTTVCRFTPWTNEEISLEGRDVTRNMQKFVLPVILKERADLAEIDGIKQEITNVEISQRYTMLTVKVYKQ